ncbi:MAG: DUF2970 domain-containing protein [Pseudomonadota bacterium]
MEVDNQKVKNPNSKPNVGHEPKILNVSPNKPHQEPHIPRWSFLKTIFGGLFGIQSDKQRRKDFENHTPSRFIFLGVIASVIVIIAVISVVAVVTS